MENKSDDLQHEHVCCMEVAYSHLMMVTSGRRARRTLFQAVNIPPCITSAPRTTATQINWWYALLMVIREGDDEQLSSSSDSDEDDVDQARVEGDGSVTRHVPHPAERITAQTGTANSHRHAGRRRPKSKVWEEFSAVLRDDKIQWAECKHCKMSLGGTSTGRTTHLRRHLKICPALPATDRMQKQRSSPHPGSTIESIWKFDQDRSLELLIKVLVSNLFSSPLTSSTTFRQLWAGICPTNDVLSDAAIEEKFLSIFENEKLKLKEEIALAPGGVFLTAASSSLETKNFIFLTVHFIDKEWNLNRKIIRCCFTGCEDFDAEYFVSMFPNLQSCHNFINGNNRTIFLPNRWYLTFHSLEAALQFNNELPDPQQIDSRYYPAKPSFAQLKAAENFCDLCTASSLGRFIGSIKK
uniref:BED-type domain-containing protein n=1 Tax=Zea mays TaxID=4577 RepID=A0A804RF98_MAIZE